MLDKYTQRMLDRTVKYLKNFNKAAHYKNRMLDNECPPIVLLQGLWMGWLTASGSLARVLGPIYVSQVYNSFGPQITFGSCCGFIALTIVFYLIVFRRVVPFSFKDESLTQYGGSAQTRQMN